MNRTSHPTEGKMGLILCFGEFLVDRFPGGPVPGGAPANVAYHLHRLGWNAVPVTAVGDDPDGKLLLQHLEEVDLSSEFTFIDEKHPTGYVDVTLGEMGEPEYVIAREVAWDYIPMSESLLVAADRAVSVVFGTLALRSGVNRRTLEGILDATSGLVVLDVNLRPPFDRLELLEEFGGRVDLLKMNEAEASRLAGEPSRVEPDHSPMVRRARLERIQGLYGPGTICATRGKSGADLLIGDRFYSENGQEVEVVDTVGAGDAFLAGLLSSLLERKDNPSESVRRACRMGELVAGKKGATPDY